LRVLTDTLVLRLLFEGHRASGITVHRDGQEETLFAGREIILAAGAYGSPQILMLSGIGPADDLTPFGIRPFVDLPVGTNLQDHPLLPMSYLTDEKSLFGAGSAADVSLFQEGRGPLTSNIAEGGVFLSTCGDKPGAGLQIRDGAHTVLRRRTVGACRSRLLDTDNSVEADQPRKGRIAIGTP
jgi:choline dehydrogenase-like flavoprotein